MLLRWRKGWIYGFFLEGCGDKSATERWVVTVLLSPSNRINIMSYLKLPAGFCSSLLSVATYERKLETGLEIKKLSNYMIENMFCEQVAKRRFNRQLYRCADYRSSHITEVHINSLLICILEVNNLKVTQRECFVDASGSGRNKRPSEKAMNPY